jgi:hypothetical protein
MVATDKTSDLERIASLTVSTEDGGEPVAERSMLAGRRDT